MEDTILQNNINEFINYYKNKLSPKSITTYTILLRSFFRKYQTIDESNLLKHKEEIQEKFAPSTVNVHIAAINNFLKFIKKEELKLSYINIQNVNFADNVIQDVVYNLLKNKLIEDGKIRDRYIVKMLAATGVRVSELINIKIEHVINHQYDCYGKGNKYRKIPILENLCLEILEWCKSENRTSGYLFRNEKGESKGEKMKKHNIWLMLKNYAKKYEINKELMYPHSFRHYFAKSFLENGGELVNLSDILGHSNINITRRYLRMTSNKLKNTMNKIVTWY